MMRNRRRSRLRCKKGRLRPEKAEIDRSFVPYEDDEVEPRSMPENDVKGLDMNISLVDAFVNAEVLLPQGEESEGYDERSNLV